MLSNINNKYLVKIMNNRKACKLYRPKINEIGSEINSTKTILFVFSNRNTNVVQVFASVPYSKSTIEWG